MKKVISVLLTAVLALALLAGCNNSSSQQSNSPAGSSEAPKLKTYQFNLATTFYDPKASPDFNVDGLAAQRFADLVNERSNGRVTVTIHWGGVLGSNNEALEQIRSGDLDMNMSNVFTSLDSRFGVFNLPNLMDDFEMVNDLFVNRDGPVFKIMHSILQDSNIELLSGSVGQFRGIFNNKSEIHVPADCRGLMLRAYSDQVVTTYWGGLCNTTIMPVPDIYTGLQLGTIDGFEFAPTAMIANGYTDVVSYYSDIGWQWQSSVNVMMNKALFDSLDAETQQLLLDCSMEATGVCYKELMEECVTEADQYMSDHGVQVYHLTDEERNTWLEYAQSLLPEFKGIVGEDVYNQMISAVDEYRANRG